MAGFEVGVDYRITRLILDECRKFHWGLAFIGGRAAPHFKILRTYAVPDTDVAREVEKQIRLRADEIGHGRTEHPIKLSDKPPVLISLPSQARDTYIATFQNVSGAQDPTHILYAQGRVELIHGAAKLVSIFALNGRSYAHFTFTCYIGCGWGGEFVVEFVDAQFRVAMFEDAGST